MTPTHRICLLAVLLQSWLLELATANTADVDVAPQVVITSVGRYWSKGGDLVRRTGTSGGVVISGATSVFMETTRSIPCAIGEDWGFEFQLVGLPADRPFYYRSEMHHPLIRQPNGEALTVSVTQRIYQPGDPIPAGEHWRFLSGFEYELVPGTWTRKIFIDDREVASIAFEVEGPVQLKSTPPLDHPLVLGVRYGAIPAERSRALRRKQGLHVVGVIEGTPAKAVGMLPGDLIVGLAGFELGTAGDIHFLLDEFAGQRVRLRIIRGSEQIVISVKLLERSQRNVTDERISSGSSIHDAILNHDRKKLDALSVGVKVVVA